MKILSLFSGIGGLERGLEIAGVGKTIAQVEIEPYPLSVLEQHWPNAQRFTDITTFTADRGAADVICGGFPCQDISVSGRGAGIKEGTRSGLWFEFARVIGQIQPTTVVIENVARLTSKGLCIVLADLNEIGYDATWDCIPAASVGAPHRRDRVFIVAWRRDRITPPRDLSFLWSSAQRAVSLDNPDPRWPVGFWPTPVARDDGKTPEAHVRMKVRMGSGRKAITSLTVMAKAIAQGWPVGPTENQHNWEPPRTTTVRENRPARLKALGNAVVPQAAEVAGRVLLGLRDAENDNCFPPVLARHFAGGWVSAKDASAVTKFPRAGTMWDGEVSECTPCAPISSLRLGRTTTGLAWPKATASDTNGVRPGSRKEGPSLRDAVRMWPTAMSRDWKDTGNMGGVNARAGRPADTLPRVVFECGDTGLLNPDWVEALMGLPVGWTKNESEDAKEKRTA